MCGIAGFLDLTASVPREAMHETAAAMAAPLRHRGPDACAVWADPAAGIAFGHTRLAVIDPSPAGAQPMASGSGRTVLAYNGEIYNAPELASDLARLGVRFRGHSDTEVLVEAIDAWGLDATLARINGMFAFAAWDRASRRLHLVRDRLGEKPLYYAWCGNTLLFGSELGALRAHPAGRFEVDRDALASYLRFGAVPAPWSIHAGVAKLPPAAILTVDPTSRPHAARPRAYWSVFDAYQDPGVVPGGDDLVDALDALLADAVRIRMRSDVPLGAFLSGGIDSSTVVALMQAQSSSPVHTFTVATTDRHYNEADAAHAVATHLQTRHTELVVTASDALAVIPDLPAIYDEPFADSSQIPTVLVSRLARQEVVVSLSGDGGDETFGGYDRYRFLPRAAARAARVPAWARAGAARALEAVPPRWWDALARPLPRRVRPRIPATKAAKYAAILRRDSGAAMYRELVTHWDDPASVVIGGRPHATLVDEPDRWPPLGDLARLAMALDTVTYLPDDILVKLDRATMSVGLEGRVPLLDHRVVEFAAALPSTAKIHDGAGKQPLRSVLHRYVPPALVDRPKTGFGVPIGEWLRGPLRAWAEELLDPARLRREGYLRPEPVRATWHDHLRRARDLESPLWAVLMFQAWLEHQRTALPAAGPTAYVVAPE